jgi:hypothetical protein
MAITSHSFLRKGKQKRNKKKLYGVMEFSCGVNPTAGQP